MKRILFILAFALVAFGASAQLQGRELTFYNELGGAVNITSDTVTNTATRFLTSQRSGGGATSTSIMVTITKAASGGGTVGGTLTLLGCNTNCSKTSVTATNWVTIMQPNLQTAIPTITPTDTSGGKLYSWNVTGSPYTYYRVQYTGATTQVAYIAATLMSH